uniref:Uncharacterized protein n=1 Tax=Rhizophora mucronata TaxID=61149 RepID=A0A2P2J753_RHIMU
MFGLPIQEALDLASDTSPCSPINRNFGTGHGMSSYSLIYRLFLTMFTAKLDGKFITWDIPSFGILL